MFEFGSDVFLCCELHPVLRKCIRDALYICLLYGWILFKLLCRCMRPSTW